MAVTFTEELVKPLKGLIDTQHKVRKSVEGMVDKTAKNLAEWRSAEAKAKKMSYQCARENEKAEELALDVRLGRGKQLSDKEINKVSGMAGAWLEGCCFILGYSRPPEMRKGCVEVTKHVEESLTNSSVRCIV